MAGHARLSASTAHRWIGCPGSVGLSESLERGDRGSSEYAREGSAAHALGEWLVINDPLTPGGLDPSDLVGVGAVLELLDEDDFVFAPNGAAAAAELEAQGVPHRVWPVDEDMADAVGVYLDVVRAIRADMDPELDTEYVEVYLDMSDLHPDLGGTGDYLRARAFHSIDVVDYKHGRGVVVEVQGNPQLMKYGVGALRMHPEVDEVRITVVQPRAAHHDGPVRTSSYTRAELLEFQGVLLEAAEAVDRPNAPFRAGEHCRFCPALGVCDEAREEVQRQAAMDFDDDPDDPDIELPEVHSMGKNSLSMALKWVPFIDAWCRAVEGEGLMRIRAGESVPGYKLVRKGTMRRISVDEAEAVRRMKKAGVRKADCLTVPKLKTPAQLEKLGPNRALTKDVVAGMSEKPVGDLTMARDDDPRPAVDPGEEAAADFEDAED